MRRVYTEKSFSRKPVTILRRALSSVMRHYRKIIIWFLSLFFFVYFLSSIYILIDSLSAGGYAKTVRRISPETGSVLPPPALQAKSAVLIEYLSGKVIFGKNEHEKLPVASTTKMLTALIARERLNLDQRITVSPAAASAGEQEIWLEPGEEINVRDLLYALLVHSANDAACVIAENVSGSVQSFAKTMNDFSRKLGATESHFTNPHGLDEEGHYSTAYDMALIGRKLLDDPVLAKIVRTKRYEIPWASRPFPRTCINHNELLSAYEGANGIKTGYTLKAGRCLVGSATRNGVSLIAVVLNSLDRLGDTARLLDYGFGMTKVIPILKKGQKVGTTQVCSFPKRFVKVTCDKDLNAVHINGTKDEILVMILVREKSRKVLAKGTSLGKAVMYYNGQEVETLKLTAQNRVKPVSTGQKVKYFLWYNLCLTGKIFSAPLRIIF